MHPARHVLHFAALGALLFAADREFARPQPAAMPAERVIERAAAFARATGSAPDARQLALLERDAFHEELLAREARRLGLDRDDAVVRERLVSNMGFVLGRDVAPDRLYREALALGMDTSDALVRRRLAARMTARLRADAARAPIDEATLRGWFDRHRDDYEEPAAVRFAQLCFARETRGGAAESRARETLASLRRDADAGAAASRRGDPCLFGSEVPLRSEAELARSFGASFTRAAFGAETGVWTGPVASSQGVHLVFVRDRVAKRAADFEAVRDAVRDACIAERQDAALRDGLAALRAQQRAR
jgi:hypothetical protein